MRQFLRFSRIARDCKINAQEGVKMRHFRAKSQHLDTLTKRHVFYITVSS